MAQKEEISRETEKNINKNNDLGKVNKNNDLARTVYVQKKSIESIGYTLAYSIVVEHILLYTVETMT